LGEGAASETLLPQWISQRLIDEVGAGRRSAEVSEPSASSTCTVLLPEVAYSGKDLSGLLAGELQDAVTCARRTPRERRERAWGNPHPFRPRGNHGAGAGILEAPQWPPPRASVIRPGPWEEREETWTKDRLRTRRQPTRRTSSHQPNSPSSRSMGQPAQTVYLR